MPKLDFVVQSCLGCTDSGRLWSKEVLYFLGEVSAHTQGCEEPIWDLALKSFHLKCLVLSGKWTLVVGLG